MAAPNILCDTAEMTNAQWLAARMHGPSGKSLIRSVAVMWQPSSGSPLGQRRWNCG